MLFKGTPLAVLEVPRRTNLTMLMRYAHLSSQHLAHYANHIDRTNLSRTQKA